MYPTRLELPVYYTNPTVKATLTALIIRIYVLDIYVNPINIRFRFASISLAHYYYYFLQAYLVYHFAYSLLL